MIKIICLILGLIASEELCAHQIEAKAGARLYPSASSKEKAIEEAKAGENFEVKERSGMFWLIFLGGNEAYIKVSDSKRIEMPQSGLEEALYKAALSHRQNGELSSQRTRAAALGVRGLSSSDVNIGDIGTLRPNLNAVYLMENKRVSNEHVQTIEALIEALILNFENSKSVH